MILSADELPDALGLPAPACRVVKMYLADDRLVAVLLPPGQLPSPAALLTATGAAAVRLASADVVNAATEYAAGLVAPILLPADMPLFTDAGLRADAVVYTPTGDTGNALGIRTRALLAVSRAQVVNLREPAALADAGAAALLPAPVTPG
jgi:prolyl-tRNA editing enzyme YbaK/EbsC (Cys-tRNA(Pro) deacylase)